MCIAKPEFVVALHVFHSVLEEIYILSNYFQTKNATLGQAVDKIEDVISSLEKNRNNFKDLWEEIELFSENEEISLVPTRGSKRKCRESSKINNDYAVESTIGKGSWTDLPKETTPFEYWRVNIYLQVIDSVIVNFKHRFENVPLAQAIDAFTRLDLAVAESFINNYKDAIIIDTTALYAETIVTKNIITNKFEEVNLENILKHVQKDFCPNLFKLLQVARAIPISSAGCERSFSAMRRIKTWLRTTMAQDRFSNLALINIESSLCKEKVTAESTLNFFPSLFINIQLFIHFLLLYMMNCIYMCKLLIY